MKLNPEKERFFYRVAGIFMRDGKVLMHKDSKEDYWVLPGGSVEFGEDSESALRREMNEELQTKIRVQRLVWICENFFSLGSKTCQEIGHYYFAEFESLPESFLQNEFEADEHFPRDDFPGFKVLFRWIPLNELSRYDIRPSFIGGGLTKLPSHPTLIVHHGL